MKIKNTFLQGKMNKDIDERLLPEGQYPHAENIRVANTDSSDIGAIENVKGNELIVDLGLSDSAECIGSEADDSNGKIYYFITSDERDGVYEYDNINRTYYPLLESTKPDGVLNFSKDNLITGIAKIYNENINKDLLFWTDNLNPPRKINIERSKGYSIDGFEEEDISVIKKPPFTKPTLLLSNTLSGEESFIKDKFISFATRFIYLDDETTTISPFSDIAFIPKPLDVNYLSGDEEGMSNAFNKVNVSFNVGGARVKRVDLLYKESGKNTVYVIESYDKSEQEWVDDSNVVVEITNRKTRAVLSESDILRPYDNVPIKAKSLEYIGNRIAYGNFTEGYDIIDTEGNPIKIDYDLSLLSEELLDGTEYLGNIMTSGNVVDDNPIIGTVNNDLISYDLAGISLDKGTILNFELSLRTIGVDDLYTPTPESQQARDAYDANYRSPLGGGYGSGELPEEGEDPDGSGSIPVYNPPALEYELLDDARGFYRTTISYEFPRDFVDISDLAGYSGFINFVENTLTGFISNNFTAPSTFIIPPISDRIDGNKQVQGFDLIYDVGIPSVISIQAPVFSYDMDNSGDQDIQNMYWVYESSNITGRNSISSETSDSNRTVKSLRSYEVGIVYKDKWGRRSSVLTSDNNTIYIDSSVMAQRNSFNLEINNPAPSWADSYSLYVKQPTLNYNTILSNTLYEEGQFVWIRIEGSNINKVKEGDKLILRQDLGDELGDTVEDLIILDVLELKTQEEDFITTNEDIVEPAGTYFKIKSGTGGNFNKTGDSVVTLNGSGRRYYLSNSVYHTEPYNGDLPSGTTIRLYHKINGSGSGATNIEFSETFLVDGNYLSLKEWYDNFLFDQSDFKAMADAHAKDGRDGMFFDEDNRYCYQPRYDHNGRKSRKLNTAFSVTIELASPLIFETFEDADPSVDIFYETLDTFNIVDGNHTGNINNQDLLTNEPARIKMSFYNSYIQKAGLETYSYYNRTDTNRLIIDQSPSSELIEGYSEVVRFADITYSEPYNEGSGFNGLSSFDLTKANFKDDIEKKYGSIQHLYARDTDLVVFQENKVSRVLYGKDALLNADGTSNISSTDLVLGQQIPFTGEYGISKNPESFDFYGQYLYFTDVKRGVVMRLDNSGLHEISNAGMNTFFKNIFKEAVDIRAGYDAFHNQYVLYVIREEGSFTVTYDEKVKGWTSFHSYSPDNIISLNNDLITFKQGNLYIHDSDNVDRNTYYGVPVDSKISVMVNESPSEIKNIQALSLEGSQSWDVILTSYISNIDDFKRSSILSTEFVKKEGIWYAHVRRDENADQEDSKSLYGIGRVMSSSDIMIVIQGYNSSLCSGDIILKGDDMTEIGTVSDITYDKKTNVSTLMMSSIINVTDNDFLVGKKDARVEGGQLRGYTTRLDLTNQSSDKTELFAVNTEVKKSYT